MVTPTTKNTKQIQTKRGQPRFFCRSVRGPHGAIFVFCILCTILILDFVHLAIFCQLPKLLLDGSIGLGVYLYQTKRGDKNHDQHSLASQTRQQ